MTFQLALYRGIPSGVHGIYNRAVRIVTHGPYSHAELIFSDGMSASSSYMDGGVRLKAIGYTSGKWDFIELPDHLEAAARIWFKSRKGIKYDLKGNMHFLFGLITHSENKEFCSGAIAAAPCR